MRHFFPICCCVLLCCLASCKQDIVSHAPNMRLCFSHDSVRFDTVFTTIGSSTRRLMVYNMNDNAVTISQVSIQEGRYFHINLDGENDLSRMRDITVRGGDSLFLFIRVNIDPQAVDIPVLVCDTITFLVNDNLQHIALQAYGQNVEIMRSDSGLLVYDNLTLTNQRPYIIYDTLVTLRNLNIQRGATLYMHTGAMIHAYGNVTANGTLESPITICGDRMDRLFDSVPYRVASGQWNGIYLLHSKDTPRPTYKINHAEILSGTIGLYVWSESADVRPNLQLMNSRIHNHSEYGLVLQNVNATVANTEISNCASYCVYIAGGTHSFVHNTIASYFGYPYTNINIHNNTFRNKVSAVYINNLNKNYAPTSTSFHNCIITGAESNNLLIATPLPDIYQGTVVGNYLQTDTLPTSFANHNVYASESDSAVYRNIYYRINEYRYYDFQLDSLSPARGIADSIAALAYPIDRKGHKRKAKPDAGCYEYLPEEIGN